MSGAFFGIVGADISTTPKNLEIKSILPDSSGIKRFFSELPDSSGEKMPKEDDRTRFSRDLTDDEKAQLKGVLGWTDKQLAKCTMRADGVILYKTDRADMVGRTDSNGVGYEAKSIVIQGVTIEGVFPSFNSKFDLNLPQSLEKASNAAQFNECNKQLKDAIQSNSQLRSSFTDEQLQDIEDGDTPGGYVWHHNEEPGRMQLVNIYEHDRTQGGAAHTGGKALWGGSYSNHEVDPSATARGAYAHLPT